MALRDVSSCRADRRVCPATHGSTGFIQTHLEVGHEPRDKGKAVSKHSRATKYHRRQIDAQARRTTRQWAYIAVSKWSPRGIWGGDFPALPEEAEIKRYMKKC